MSNSLKVSVLMPAYNAGPYLAEAIDSILSQTYRDFNFIICDDCSTDDTLQIIQKYAAIDSRIVVIKNDKNLGIAKTRNRLVEHSTAEYIAWQEADDISLPQRLEHQVSFMEQNPDVAICGGYLECFNTSGVIGVRKYPVDNDSLRKLVFRYAPVAEPAAIIRKSCLDVVGPYSVQYTPADDLEMTLRLGANYKMANLPEIVLKFRLHNTANSTTFSKLKILELNTLAVRRQYIDKYKMTLLDRLYNMAQYVSIYTIPPGLKIQIFNRWRNSKS